jgi:FAD dependent oxidoreductase TIGR03364
MLNKQRYDVAVVGAGIIGLATAFHAARAGLKTAVFERNVRATGASIRNFGMIWPIGQPAGEMRTIALRSREIWLEVLHSARIWHRKSGSLHLAYAEDELGVLEEFVQGAPAWGYDCEILSPTETISKSPVIRREGLMGAMWSPSELCVFPRQVVRELPTFLASLGVDFYFETAVTQVETGRILAGGKEWGADQTFICSGDDFESLFPQHFKQSGLTRSKLQMMRAKPKKAPLDIGTHLCAGLTLGHYANFRQCDRLPKLLERFESDYPLQQKWGIHLLVSQHEDGLLTIGDSHEYGLEVTPFLREEIDRLILEYLDTFLPIDEIEICERWHGVYAKHPTKSYIIDDVEPNVKLVTGVGGAGMTLSFGLTERLFER